ncbi:MAG: carbohydrate ABC transporter permease [Chloroflexi bacterium]|nr:carbohydrate ABC transporter permease [Chloroflexota bacterium]
MTAEDRVSPLSYAILLILAFLFIFPFVWLVLTSFESNFDVIAHPTQLIPPVWHLSNYSDVWQVMDFVRQFTNSAIMTVGVTLGQVILSAMAGYAFARLRFRGRTALFLLVLALLLVPFEVIFVPLYLMLSNWGWINTYQALILPSLANPFAIFVFRQFFLTIPKDLDEAMYIDGAGTWRIFWSLMLPLSGPAIATVTILTFLGEWSTLLKPLAFTSSESMRTLQVGLSYLNSGAFISQPKLAWLMAGVVLVSIPPIVVFLIFQERFVRSVASSGVKG